jgi:branched-subunit amino acid ABC-type transport system permease component
MMSRETAATLGIRTGRINALAFALGCALAGFAGALLSPLLPIEPSTGLDFLIDSFFVVLVGGAGSIAGTAAGGLVIGGGQSAIELVATPALSSILVLCLAVAIISLRPRGLAFRR